MQCLIVRLPEYLTSRKICKSVGAFEDVRILFYASLCNCSSCSIKVLGKEDCISVDCAAPKVPPVSFRGVSFRGISRDTCRSTFEGHFRGIDPGGTPQGTSVFTRYGLTASLSSVKHSRILKTLRPNLPSIIEIAMSEVILYDIPSKDPRHCWSLNPWKS